MLDDQQLDLLIAKAIREEIDSIEVPPGSKERVRQKLGLAKPYGTKRFRWGRWSMTLAGILTSIVVLVCLGTPPQASAIGPITVTRVVHRIKDTIGNISQSYSREREGPAPSGQSLGREVECSFDEARASLTFPLLLPQYLPPDFSLDSAKLMVAGDDTVEGILLRYKSSKGTLTIIQEQTYDNAASGIIYDTDDTEVEQVRLRGSDASLLTHKDGTSFLFWYENGVSYSVKGPCTKEEIIEVAEKLAAEGT